MAAYEALVDTADQKSWEDFNRKPVSYYFEKMIGHWLLNLMDKALTDKQLAAVEPVQVQILVLSLFICHPIAWPMMANLMNSMT